VKVISPNRFILLPDDTPEDRLPKNKSDIVEGENLYFVDDSGSLSLKTNILRMGLGLPGLPFNTKFLWIVSTISKSRVV
jgi:hypothetical protein